MCGEFFVIEKCLENKVFTKKAKHGIMLNGLWVSRGKFMKKIFNAVIDFLKWIKRTGIAIGKKIDYALWKIGDCFRNVFLRKNYDARRNNKKKEVQKYKIGLVVTEAGDGVTAGDYFTALELSLSLQKLGHDIVFIENTAKDKYKVDEDLDILICLLEEYDIRRLGKNKENIIKVAWARNWFEAWAKQPWMKEYDYVLASSEKAVDYMASHLQRKVHLLKIGTNTERFHKDINVDKQYECDYCFTGSYWKEPREIMHALTPELVGDYRFHLYGANWDKIEKFSPYNRGFVEYKELPRVYRNTKVLIDDANRVTKPFGSVNSRVFDALASGVLVLTNGKLGAENTFGGLLPTYETPEELLKLLTYYLEHEEERELLVKKLEDNVRSCHSYDCRAKEFLEILSEAL